MCARESVCERERVDGGYEYETEMKIITNDEGGGR